MVLYLGRNAMVHTSKLLTRTHKNWRLLLTFLLESIYLHLKLLLYDNGEEESPSKLPSKLDKPEIMLLKIPHWLIQLLLSLSVLLELLIQAVRRNFSSQVNISGPNLFIQTTCQPAGTYDLPALSSDFLVALPIFCLG